MQNERLDLRLARETELTRSRVEKLIREGLVLVDGKVQKKPGFLVHATAKVIAQIPAPVPMQAFPEAIPIDIIYEDEAIAVVNKPCGMVVHPAAGNDSGTLVNALLYALHGLSGIGGTLRPGIVHRLDKDTSGLLLIAKTDTAHIALSEALKNRQVEKKYTAIVYGHFKTDNGTISLPIARHPKNRKKMAVVQDGKEAITEYKIVEEFKNASYVLVNLVTGRTHQIRVHFAHIGHPILGDSVYGNVKTQFAAPRMMLHAASVSFMHPTSGQKMRFEAPIPSEFANFSRVLHKLPGDA